MSAEDSKAVVQWEGDDLFKALSPSGHVINVDTDSSRRSAASPMELLLLALGSCTGVDVISILKKKRAEVSDYRVELRGQRRAKHPRSYQQIAVHHIITGRNISRQSMAQAVRLSDEKYCSVAATLRPAAEIVSTFEIIEIL
ncbi:MAG TPA: OsmC family protein [Pyrinomonadaceae bacterium]|jgi:putative redox protein